MKMARGKKMRPAIERRPGTASLLETMDRVLDRGLVIDARRFFNLGGVYLITVDSFTTVTSIDTFLKYA